MTESPAELLERAAVRLTIDGTIRINGEKVSAQPFVAWLQQAKVMYGMAERSCKGKPVAAVHARVSSADRAAVDFARQVVGEQ